MSWIVLYTPAAQRDVKAIRKRYHHLVKRMTDIDGILRRDPTHPSHHFEALRGDLSGYYSRRLDGFNRVIYRIEAPDVVVVSLLGHYGDT